MCTKVKVVLAMVAMLSLVGSAQAVDPTYLWGNASGDWATPAIWGGSTRAPSPVYVEGQPWDIAILIGGVTVNVTTAGQGTVDLYGGYDTGINTLNIAAGINLQVTHTSQIAVGNNTTSNTTAIVNTYGSYYSEGLTVGTSKYCTGIVNVYTGGAVNVGAWNAIVGRPDADTVGTGAINLIGGTMTSASALTINPMGLINIEAGTLKVLGDYRTQLQGYINTGKIVGYNGAGTVNAAALVDGYTVVTAIPEPATMILLGLGGLLLRRRMA